jgi:clan AA aspartic protease
LYFALLKTANFEKYFKIFFCCKTRNYSNANCNFTPYIGYVAFYALQKYYREEYNMGMVYTEITLKNVDDGAIARGGYIRPENVRTATVTAVADTGSMNLVIPEELRQKLGLGVREEKTVHIANGQRVNGKITDAVEVHWKNRYTIVPALVIPGAEKVLMGAIVLEGMDLMVNPVTQEVVGVHGDKEEYYALTNEE